MLGHTEALPIALFSFHTLLRVQVAALKKNFAEAQNRIGVVSTNLRGQWHQSMALQVRFLPKQSVFHHSCKFWLHLGVMF